MWLWILFTVVLVIIIHKFLQVRKFRKILSKLPGLKTRNFLIGDLHVILSKKKHIGFHAALSESEYALATLFREEGFFRFWSSVEPYIFVYSAENIEAAISRIIDKPKAYNLLHCWLGTGLLTSNGGKWKTRRKMITPTFHYQILNQFIPVFDKNSKMLIENMKDHLDKDWIDITPVISLCTLDIISETAMGVDIKSSNISKSDYIRALQEFSDIFMVRAMKPWLFNDFLFNLTAEGKKLKRILATLHGLTLNILKQRREELKMKQSSIENITDIASLRGEKEALLDTLIKYQFKDSNFSDEDICEEVDTFMFEGHDTTSLGICWALYYLGLYPDIQQKVYEELLGIFGDDKERSITPDDIRNMKYLECVLKESQRLSPSVPEFGRACTEDIEMKGKTIPRGSTVSFLVYALHRDPKVFPDPEIFDPDRFLPENCIGRHPFAFIPFSAGSRNCIGQKYALLELKVIVSRMIMNYKIESIEPRDKITCTFLLVLRPEEGFKLKLTARE